MLKYFERLLLIAFLTGFISICFAEENGINSQDASSEKSDSFLTQLVSFFSFEDEEEEGAQEVSSENEKSVEEASLDKDQSFFTQFISFFSFENDEIEIHETLPDKEISAQVVTSENVYTLGSGDLLKIIIFNQEDLSGQYKVNGKGDISLPLIGTIGVKGLTLLQVEERLKNKLQPDYLLNPQVSLQVMNFRPFYILGEVVGPKSYSYVDGMTYLNAIAIAGGYTYRAKKGYVYVIRGNDSERNEIKLTTDKKVMPGDTIRVDERFF